MFPKQGLATWHCCNYPDSLDDRVEPGALLCTILFLVDGKCSSLQYLNCHLHPNPIPSTLSFTCG